MFQHVTSGSDLDSAMIWSCLFFDMVRVSCKASVALLMSAFMPLSVCSQYVTLPAFARASNDMCASDMPFEIFKF